MPGEYHDTRNRNHHRGNRPPKDPPPSLIEERVEAGDRKTIFLDLREDRGGQRYLSIKERIRADDRRDMRQSIIRIPVESMEEIGNILIDMSRRERSIPSA